MSLSAAIDGPLHLTPSMPPFRETPQVVSLSEPNLFLQGSIQVEKVDACTTSVLSGLVASILTKNPLPLLLGLGGCLPRIQSQQKIGTEFQANTYTNSSQMFSPVAGLSNGNFVVVWASAGQDLTNTYGVFGQLFDENASKIGNEFQVNTYADNDQTRPSVIGLNNDNFVVTWQSFGQDNPNDDGIFGQLFNSNRSKIGNEFQVNSKKNNDQSTPSGASLRNGYFVVTWHSFGQDLTNTYGVFGQLFDENASKIGNEFQVNTYTNSAQMSPSVSGLRNGYFVVAWVSRGQDNPNSDGVFGQLFFENASKIGNEFQINTYTLSSQWRLSVTGLSNGNFVMAWESRGQDGFSGGIFGQLFSENGSKIGNEFQVNTYINSDQTLPSVTSLMDSNFVVTWSSHGQDGSNYGIFGQLFADNATKIGNEFQVNTYTNNVQISPSVASLSNGNFVVTWSSYDQDGSGSGVFGQLFNDLLITSSTATSTTFSTSTTSTVSLPSSSSFISLSIATTSTSTPASFTSPKASSPKRTRLVTIISLGVGGLVSFCLVPLGFFLLRKRRSQTDVDLSEEIGVAAKSFQLEPIVQRHKIIGKAYSILSTIVKEEAEEIYLQTGHLILFLEGQKKLPYVIGSGQFGKIKVAQRIEDNQYAASKKVKGADNMRASKAEAQMQHAAAGDNVLPIFNTIQLEDALYHFMPLAGLGDGIAIQRRLAILNQSPLALMILTFIAQNILTGLQTIHAKGIYHLDIKPDNLVFTKDGIAYITDFGCAQRPESRHLTGTALGDNRYFSPERLRACKERTFDAEQADMWAAGVTLLQIFYNQDPLELLNMSHRLAARVERCDQEHFDEQLQRFFSEAEEGSIWWVIKRLLDTNPKTRLTATQALQAHCFHGLDKTHQEHAFEDLRRETFAQHQGIETSQVDLRDYGWVVSRAPEEERVEGYRSENYRQFYGYTLTPDLYQFTPEHVTASSAASGYQLTP